MDIPSDINAMNVKENQGKKQVDPKTFRGEIEF
jgi:hypothetical protein